MTTLLPTIGALAVVLSPLTAPPAAAHGIVEPWFGSVTISGGSLSAPPTFSWTSDVSCSTSWTAMPYHAEAWCWPATPGWFGGIAPKGCARLAMTGFVNWQQPMRYVYRHGVACGHVSGSCEVSSGASHCDPQPTFPSGMPLGIGMERPPLYCWAEFASFSGASVVSWQVSCHPTYDDDGAWLPGVVPH